MAIVIIPDTVTGLDCKYKLGLFKALVEEVSMLECSDCLMRSRVIYHGAIEQYFLTFRRLTGDIDPDNVRVEFYSKDDQDEFTVDSGLAYEGILTSYDTDKSYFSFVLDSNELEIGWYKIIVKIIVSEREYIVRDFIWVKDRAENLVL